MLLLLPPPRPPRPGRSAYRGFHSPRKPLWPVCWRRGDQERERDRDLDMDRGEREGEREIDRCPRMGGRLLLPNAPRISRSRSRSRSRGGGWSKLRPWELWRLKYPPLPLPLLPPDDWK